MQSSNHTQGLSSERNKLNKCKNVRVDLAMYCDKASLFFSDVIAGTCVEEEGKGRGFLPSLQGKNQPSRTEEEGWKGRKRDKREEKTGREGESWKLRWSERKCGKEEGRTGKERRRRRRQKEVLDESGGRGDTGH